MTDYPFTFDKHIGIFNSFQNYISNAHSNVLGLSGDANSITVVFSSNLNPDQIISLSNNVVNYNDPSYWLNLDHTNNFPLFSEQINSTTGTTLQSFILSPYDQDNIVIGSLKTICKYNTSDLSYFANFNSNISPMKFSLSLCNVTKNQFITSNSTDINEEIQSKWVPLANAGCNFAPPIFKTIQLFGLKDYTPGSDCMFNLNGHVSDSNLYVNLNGLQQLYYQVELPQ
jgi:hypothetical protein